MVRIVKAEKKQAPAKLDDKGKATLSLLGIAISNEPLRIKRLLENYGIQVKAQPTPQELINKTLFLIEQNNKAFNYDLAELLTRQVIPDNYDGFNAQDVAGATDGANVTVGSDPVSAIAGAIGSIASIFGNVQQKKMLKEQAKSQTMSSILAYKAQQEQSVNESRRAANKNAIIMTVGILALAALFGWFFFGRTSNQQVQTSTT